MDRRHSSCLRVPATPTIIRPQVEGGEGEGGEPAYEQILPTPDLLDIYRRITENEIKVG